MFFDSLPPLRIAALPNDLGYRAFGENPSDLEAYLILWPKLRC